MSFVFRLTDLTWSPDNRMLVASSTDGFCSILTFSKGELGEIVTEEKILSEKTGEDNFFLNDAYYNEY